jgi:hypothetical protein
VAAARHTPSNVTARPKALRRHYTTPLPTKPRTAPIRQRLAPVVTKLARTRWDRGRPATSRAFPCPALERLLPRAQGVLCHCPQPSPHLAHRPRGPHPHSFRSVHLHHSLLPLAPWGGSIPSQDPPPMALSQLAPLLQSLALPLHLVQLPELSTVLKPLQLFHLLLGPLPGPP